VRGQYLDRAPAAVARMLFAARLRCWFLRSSPTWSRKPPGCRPSCSPGTVIADLLSGTRALRDRAALELRVRPFGYRDGRDYRGIADPAAAFAHQLLSGSSPHPRPHLGHSAPCSHAGAYVPAPDGGIHARTRSRGRGRGRFMPDWVPPRLRAHRRRVPRVVPPGGSATSSASGADTSCAGRASSGCSGG
jgi:hypothetical protein